MVEEFRCPKCKQMNKLKFFPEDKDTKHAYYKCFSCGLVAVPTEIKCHRCKNERFRLILSKDCKLYCIICWRAPLCSYNSLKRAATKSRDTLSGLK